MSGEGDVSGTQEQGNQDDMPGSEEHDMPGSQEHDMPGSREHEMAKSEMSEPQMEYPGMISTSHPAIIRSSNWRNFRIPSQKLFPAGTSRTEHRANRLMSQTFNFFGVGDNCQSDQQRWRCRSTRHMSRRHGGFKPEVERELEREEANISPFSPFPHIIDPLAKPRSRDDIDSGRGPLPSQVSTGSSVLQKQYSHKLIRQRSKRQSVAKMGWEAIRHSVKKGSLSSRGGASFSHNHLAPRKPPLIHSRSFAPASYMMDFDDEDEVDSTQFFSPTVISEDIHDEVFFDFSPKPKRREVYRSSTLPRIDSVVSDTETSGEYGDRVRESASLPLVLEASSTFESSVDGDVEDDFRKRRKTYPPPEEEDAPELPLHVAFSDEMPLTDRGEPPPDDFFDYRTPMQTPGEVLDGRMKAQIADVLPTGVGWRKTKDDERFKVAPYIPQDIPDSAVHTRTTIRRNKIHDKIMRSALDTDNSDRRIIGKGLVGRVLNRDFRSKRMDSYVQKQIEQIEDHRPYFTYWVTTVQAVIMIVSLAFYGFAPIGFSYTQKTDLVLQSNLVMETVGYKEPDNFWIGPRPADLIHLGAKYSPCMHRDEEVHRKIEEERAIESESGCCIRTDGAGCLQTLDRDCSTIFATFHKWPDVNDPSFGRTSGPVCGQDPRECLYPPSTPPYVWPDNITGWEICTKFPENHKHPHTQCEVTGRPCCIGIQGECKIVSKGYCSFVNGFFHEEATLCSQVSCMDDICGLINFVNPEYPDQFYRLWLSTFMHAGIFHCILTIIMQMTILRDVEKLAGWLRISVIYIFSGIGGNLMSAIFIPYRAEVGPAGAQFGLLACLVVEVLQNWQMLKYPWKALGKLFLIIAVLFVLGLLPWIDNFAHLGGFICGILLSFIFLPYIYFGEFDKRRKRLQIVVCLILLVCYFVFGFLLFYTWPVRDCALCQFFNCIPITEDFCNDMTLRLDDRTVM